MKYQRFVPLTAALAASAAFAAPMEHNAFLVRPVFSRQQLLDQFRSSKEVQARYVAHFGMKPARIEEYFKTLRLAPLAKGKRYLAFNVDPKTKKVGRRLLFFPKGTLVFIDAKGKPILKRSCGNPMVTYIPAIDRPAVVFAPVPQEEESIAAVAPQTTETTPEPEEEMNANPGITPDPAPVAQPVAPTAPLTPEPAVVPAAIPPVVAAAGASIWPGIIGGAALVGGVIAGTNDNSPVVPEPTTMTVMAIGAGLGAYRKRRRR